MRFFDTIKDLKNIGQDLLTETAEVKKHLDAVQIEAAYAQFVLDDIKKDIAEYQFQAQPRLDAINDRAEKIKNELSK